MSFSQTFCFDYPVARRILTKYRPPSPSCARGTYIYAVCFPGTRVAWLWGLHLASVSHSRLESPGRFHLRVRYASGLAAWQIMHACVCVCVCGGRWQLGSITLRSVERAWLAQWLMIHYLRLNCYHLIWKSYCRKHIWFQRQMTCFILSQHNEFTIAWCSVKKKGHSLLALPASVYCSTCHGSVFGL